MVLICEIWQTGCKLIIKYPSSFSPLCLCTLLAVLHTSGEHIRLRNGRRIESYFGFGSRGLSMQRIKQVRWNGLSAPPVGKDTAQKKSVWIEIQPNKKTCTNLQTGSRDRQLFPGRRHCPVGGGLWFRVEQLCGSHPCGLTWPYRSYCTKRSSTFVVCTGIRL